mmetsp:Transcript_116284/g.315747  ORF Transcript_116284/g.315747 Transcript_116284/m.315747 type:complete len:355 (+) Transcript_116284:109-1173(+)
MLGLREQRRSAHGAAAERGLPAECGPRGPGGLPHGVRARAGGARGRRGGGGARPGAPGALGSEAVVPGGSARGGRRHRPVRPGEEEGGRWHRGAAVAGEGPFSGGLQGHLAQLWDPGRHGRSHRPRLWVTRTPREAHGRVRPATDRRDADLGRQRCREWPGGRARGEAAARAALLRVALFPGGAARPLGRGAGRPHGGRAVGRPVGVPPRARQPGAPGSEGGRLLPQHNQALLPGGRPRPQRRPDPHRRRRAAEGREERGGLLPRPQGRVLQRPLVHAGEPPPGHVATPGHAAAAAGRPAPRGVPLHRGLARRGHRVVLGVQVHDRHLPRRARDHPRDGGGPGSGAARLADQPG